MRVNWLLSWTIAYVCIYLQLMDGNRARIIEWILLLSRVLIIEVTKADPRSHPGIVPKFSTFNASLKLFFMHINMQLNLTITTFLEILYVRKKQPWKAVQLNFSPSVGKYLYMVCSWKGGWFPPDFGEYFLLEDYSEEGFLLKHKLVLNLYP